MGLDDILPKEQGAYHRRITKAERVEEIRQAFNSGANTLEAIAQQVGLSEGTVYEYVLVSGIKLPEYKMPKIQHPKRRPEIDEMIDKGLSLEAMGVKVGNSRENIRIYINKTKQYNVWREKRQEAIQAPKIERQQRNQLLGRLDYILRERAYELAKQEGWPQQKALEYVFLLKIHQPYSYPYDLLVTIFSRKEKAKNNGDILTLEELGQGLDIWPAGVGRILKIVGEEPMYGSLDTKRISEGKREAISRGFYLNMPIRDIAYFLDVPDYVVPQYFSGIGTRPKSEYLAVMLGVNGRQLSYRLLSQIYEAQDASFERNEIAQLLDIKEKVVNFAIENRSDFALKIVSALWTLHNNSNISTPYQRV